MRRVVLLSLAALALAGCNATTQAPPTAAAVAAVPPIATLPQGEGCAGAVARWKAIQSNDLAMGHVTRPVYDRIQGEIAEAETACAAGRDAEARGLVAASRKRHGYPAG